jgi:hypothetical protein
MFFINVPKNDEKNDSYLGKIMGHLGVGDKGRSVRAEHDSRQQISDDR